MDETVVATKPKCRGTTAEGEPCKSPFMGNDSEWCLVHDPDRREEHQRLVAKGGRAMVTGRKTCALDGCNNRLTNRRTKWCSDSHGGIARAREIRERKDLEAGITTVAARMIRPPQAFFDEGWDRYAEHPDHDAVAARFGVDRTTSVRWYAWVRQQKVFAAARDDWAPPPRDFPEKWRDLRASHVPALIADFVWFRARFCETEDEEPFLIADFHEVWIELLIRTFVTRGRCMILSPPRHGKTELLAHLVLWLIARFPNVRIIWVGPSDEIAELPGQEVLDHLTSNTDLIETFVGPGGSFKPKGKGRAWVKSEMTVSTRTVFGIKSPTVRFQGRGGTLVSRDADVIIADDIEQDKTVSQPGTREKTRTWASTQLFSRKTKKTAIAVIGSRQHPDDLWQHFLDNEMFETIVETAHDENCEIPQNDPSRYHDHESCMLWAELNDFEWLSEMRILNETLGGRDTFEMVYLNRVTGLGMVVFDAVEIAESKSRHYKIGQIPEPVKPEGMENLKPEDIGGVRLVAGLDPAGSGYQAAFLWAYQVKPELRMWMVDIENHEGGGIAQARKTIEGWHTLHGVSHWVVEENLYHGGILADEKLIELRQSLSILMEPHHTGHNKWDPYLGVSTLKPLFADKKIILPYGDVESVSKSDLYQRQLVNFSNAPRNRNTRGGYKSDLVMASWFPMGVIRLAQSEFISDIAITYDTKAEEAMFSTYDWDDVPWKDDVLV
jgi:hypothetical protein